MAVTFKTHWIVGRTHDGEMQALRRFGHRKFGYQFMWVEMTDGRRHKFRSQAAAAAAVAEHGGDVVPIRSARMTLAE
jgi:hypothetical protein